MRRTLKKGKIMEQEIDWEQEIYGRGYEKLDWERERKKKRDFWVALDGMSTGVALIFDWFWTFGSSVDVIRPFLKLTGEKTESFPCPAETPCGCRHTIGETRRDELIATCCCEWRCGTYELEPADILFHGVDFERFGGAIRQALGFAKPSEAGYVSAGLREIATHAAATVPVYLSLEGPDGLLRELTKLLGQRDVPFLVLTPTGSSWSPEVEAMARPHAGGHISLSSVLGASPDGFTSNGAIEPMLAEFSKRLIRGSNVATVVQRIDDNLQAIAKGSADLRQENRELKSAKQRLEGMLAGGMFAFMRRVDAKSFHVFCTILAEGDVSKAARTLGMGDSTLRDLLRDWRGRGGAYKRMLDVVRWRKRVGRTEMVPLNDDIILGKARSADYPALLSELLDGLLSMTESNWEELSKELAEMLEAEMG
jgi:hypothetical protein